MCAFKLDRSAIEKTHTKPISVLFMRNTIKTKGPRCFLEQETLPLLLSTGWFQERIRA